jgi:RNA polymerase sigma-70 factor (sigma-E family)
MSYQIWAAGSGYPPPDGQAGLGQEADGAGETGEVLMPRDLRPAVGGQAPRASASLGGEPAPGASHSGGAEYGVTALFRAHHAELVRLAVLMTGDRASAEDIVQDVFARLCARDQLPDPGNALAYVRAAVLNGCRSALRRRAVARRFGGARDSLGADVTQRSAESEALLAEDRRQVLAALAGLSRRRREVLVLRYWLGLPEAEIAAVLGISTGTVKSTAARGIAALGRQLGESA